MVTDLDTRARRAATAIHAAVEGAEPRLLHQRPDRRLRAVWVLAALLIGSAVGLALTGEQSRPSEPSVSTSTTETAPATTMASTTTTARPVAPVSPATTPAALPDNIPPPLVITYPADGSETSEKVIEFAGTTEPGASVRSGPYQAEVDGSGVWRLVLVLSEGWNTARFTAQDHAGNESEATVTVRYSPVEASTTTEPPTTTTEEKQLAAFEAYATFGSCAEEPPYDVYYGRGQPGSTVVVKSEYGGGETLVNQEGDWELKVFFEGMTPGQTIVVKARDEFGREKLLEFTFQP
jgi:hypothetical protein